MDAGDQGNQEGVERPSASVVRAAFLEGQRKIRTQDVGAAANPKRDLQKSQWAEPLREVPWKARLAYLMAMFATSNDVGSDWPYDKFAARLQSPVDLTWLAVAGVTDRDLAAASIEVPARGQKRDSFTVSREDLLAALAGDPDAHGRAASLFPPPEVDIVQSVEEVASLLEDCRLAWFNANIAIPMGVRASSSMVGTESVEMFVTSTGDGGGGDSHEDPRVALAGDRLGRDHRDTREISLATLRVDLGNARDFMSAERDQLPGRTHSTMPHASPATGPDYRRAVLDAAIEVVDVLTAKAATSTDLQDAIELVYDDSRTWRPDEGKATSMLILNAAHATAPKLLEGDFGQEYCEDIAAEVGRAITATWKRPWPQRTR